MHHSMPPSKTEWPSSNKRGDFSTCNAPRPGRPKAVTAPEIIDQIHELILENRRISANSIAEQLGVSRERVGSIIHEDLDKRKLSAKHNVWCVCVARTHTKRYAAASPQLTFYVFNFKFSDFNKEPTSSLKMI